MAPDCEKVWWLFLIKPDSEIYLKFSLLIYLDELWAIAAINRFFKACLFMVSPS